MKIAVISDIHGNCLALDKVLADIREQGIEQIVCLGDAIQGGPQPAQTAARLRELGCPIVMGNADAWLLSGLETSQNEQVSAQQLAVREWQLAQLSTEDKAFIQSFQPTIEMTLEDGKKLLCFHGSPHSFDDIILPNTPEDTVEQLLSGFDATLYTGGHTHTQQMRRLGAIWYFNPGSIGFAYDWRQSQEGFRADAWSDYAIVESQGEHFGVSFRHVPFDANEYIRVIQESGKPNPAESIAAYKF